MKEMGTYSHGWLAPVLDPDLPTEATSGRHIGGLGLFLVERLKLRAMNNLQSEIVDLFYEYLMEGRPVYLYICVFLFQGCLTFLTSSQLHAHRRRSAANVEAARHIAIKQQLPTARLKLAKCYPSKKL
jgi:hypothetical protein